MTVLSMTHIDDSNRIEFSLYNKFDTRKDKNDATIKLKK